MKILLRSDPQNPTWVDIKENTLRLNENGILGLNLTGKPHSGVVVRHPGELVLRDGWICLDYDDEGYLVGLEIHEGDPFGANTKNMKYLQPKNPLEK